MSADPYAPGGSNSPFNEAGEPIMSASDWRREQECDARMAEEAAAFPDERECEAADAAFEQRYDDAYGLAQEICAPVRNLVRTHDVEGYDKWLEAVTDRLMRLKGDLR